MISYIKLSHQANHVYLTSVPQQAEREAMTQRLVIEHFSDGHSKTIHVATEVGLLDTRADLAVTRHLEALTQQWVDSPDCKTGINICLYGQANTDIKEITLINPKVRYGFVEDVIEAIKNALYIPADIPVSHVHTDWWRLFTPPRMTDKEHYEYIFG